MDPPVRPSEELKASSAAGRLIEVRRSVHESGRIELPRNGKTRRVDMSQQLADELRWLHASRVKETLKGPGGDNKAAVVRHRPAPSATEHNSGATDRSVTPRQVLVELRGLEPLTPRLPEPQVIDKLSKDKKRRSAKRGKK
jgi:hypothetical protein